MVSIILFECKLCTGTLSQRSVSDGRHPSPPFRLRTAVAAVGQQLVSDAVAGIADRE
jgi:hypothetical protein